MHELGIAAEIRKLSRDAVAGLGEGRIERVTVAVGELAAVEPALLVHAWDALVAGGPDEGARLEVRWIPTRQVCPICGERRDRAAGSWLRLCPDCARPLRVEGGMDLDLLQVAFAAADELGGTT